MSYDNCQLNLFFFCIIYKNCNHGTGNRVGILESVEGTGSHLGANTEIGKA